MRNIGRSGMIAGLVALILAVGGAAVLVSYAVADPDGKAKPEKKDEGRGLASSTLGF